MEETKEHLKREIGVSGLTANMVNSIVGSGIFVLPAVIAGGLGPASIYAYLFCGVLVTLVMLCFAEVASKVTKSGGAYAYIETAFGPYFGFLTALTFTLSSISGDAAIANAIADIVGSMLPAFKVEFIRILFFIFSFGVLAYINIKGVKESMTLVKTITIIKLAPLLLLILFGWGHVSIDNLVIESTPSLLAVGNMSLILFFAFQGGECALCVGGEVKNPNQTIPKGILFGILTVLILYILIQTVSQGVLGDELPNFKENTLSVVAENIFGPIGFTVLTIGAAVSMYGTLSSEVLSIPRIFFRASRDHILPFRQLTKVHPKFHTPYISILLYTVLGFTFASLGGFKQLAIFSSAGTLLVYLGVSLSVIKLRLKNINPTEKTFKIRGGYTIPVLSILIIGLLLSNLSQKEIIAVIIFIAVLSVIYFVRNKVIRK